MFFAMLNQVSTMRFELHAQCPYLIIAPLVHVPVDEFMFAQSATNLSPDVGEQQFIEHGQATLFHNRTNKNTFDIHTQTHS